jgi:hypothetical protein
VGLDFDYQAQVLEGQKPASNLNSEEANLQILEVDHEINKKQIWVFGSIILKPQGNYQFYGNENYS